jgi:hypothetical protein
MNTMFFQTCAVPWYCNLFPSTVTLPRMICFRWKGRLQLARTLRQDGRGLQDGGKKGAKGLI